MYPRISDFINDITGWSLCLPIQSFGFFVALAFMAAYWTLTHEIRRMQGLHIFPTTRVKVMQGGPIPETEVLISFLLFGVLGYKLGLMFDGYGSFCDDPQGAILSLEGNLPAGIIGAVLGGGYRFWQYWQKRGEKPVEVEEEQGLLGELGTVLTIAFIGGLLGAKIFHNLEYWDDFIKDPAGALLSFDGLTFYGGLIVAAVGIAIFLRRKGYAVLPFADAIAPGLMLGYGIGRIGCQVAGDGDWGIVNTGAKPDWLSWAPDWVWAFDYPNNVLGTCDPDLNSAPRIACGDGQIPQLVEAVFPTPFYETLMAILIFAGLWMIRKRLPYWGQLSGIYLVFNGIERFLIEKIRVNSTYNLAGFEITQAELISSVMILMGLLLFYLATFKWKKPYQGRAPIATK